MKPDWDKLMDAFAGSSTQLVADVDCTAEGKPLCDANGVRGYPTIKWGDPSALEDYKGGRDFKTLKSWADKNLVPICSPSNVDLCDDDKKAEIKKFQDMSAKDLDALIKEKEDELSEAEAFFKEEVNKLQNMYKQIQSDKEDKLQEIKDSGLGLAKAVKAASKSSSGSDEL